MKHQGGSRNSPQEKSEYRLVHRCPQCNIVSHNKTALEQHVKQIHSNEPSCPFCFVGFRTHQFLRKHIDDYHKERTLKRVQNNNSVVQSYGVGKTVVKKRPCAFFTQPKGCKKGLDWDFSHDLSNRGAVLKVHKLCRNGLNCSWKPGCKFIHLEDGEVMPHRAQRDQVQDFVMPNVRQPPPGFTLASSRDFPSLQRKSQEQEREQQRESREQQRGSWDQQNLSTQTI